MRKYKKAKAKAKALVKDRQEERSRSNQIAEQYDELVQQNELLQGHLSATAQSAQEVTNQNQYLSEQLQNANTYRILEKLFTNGDRQYTKSYHQRRHDAFIKWRRFLAISCQLEFSSQILLRSRRD